MKYAGAREHHWPAVFGRIDQHVNGKPPFRSHPPPGRARAEIERQVRVTGKKLTPTAAAFAAKYRDNPRAIAKYLNDALSTGDPVLITRRLATWCALKAWQAFRRRLECVAKVSTDRLAGKRAPR